MWTVYIFEYSDILVVVVAIVTIVVMAAEEVAMEVTVVGCKWCWRL